MLDDAGWRGSPPVDWRITGWDGHRQIVLIGDSITYQVGQTLGRLLAGELPALSPGFAHVAQTGTFGTWSADDGWADVAATTSNLGFAARPDAARRSLDATVRTLTWTRPRWATVDRATIWWVDDAEAADGWSYSVDGGATWVDVDVVAPQVPALRSVILEGLANPTAVTVRNARADGVGSPSAVFLGIDARGPSGWVLHNLGSSGGCLTGSPGAFDGASCAPERGASPVEFLRAAMPSPALVLCQHINDAKAGRYDEARITAALGLLGIAWSTRFVAVDMYPVNEATFPHQAELHRLWQSLFPAGIDLAQRPGWGPQAADAIASGFLLPDGTHPTKAGITDLAVTIASYLRAH